MGSIDLRNAKSNDVWRSLFKRNDRFYTSISIDYLNIAELGSGQIILENTFNLICGENGAGKTAILALILRSLRTKADFSSNGIDPFGDKSLTGTISQTKVLVHAEKQDHYFQSEKEIKELLKTNQENEIVCVIDPAESISKVTSIIKKDENFDDLLNGVTPIEISEDDLALISHIVGKTYSKIEVFEIDTFDDIAVFPYFNATYGNATYDTAAMGKGEACLLYLFWAINRLNRKSIVLIEEPDAFAALRSHRSIADYLAGKCEEGNHMFVMASHSGGIAERFPDKAIYLCTRTQQGIAIRQSPPASELISRVGLNLHHRITSIVEDECAGAFLNALLHHIDSRLANCVGIACTEGNGGIYTALKTLIPKQGSSLKIIGVWDADQDIGKFKDSNWPKICLPGSRSPEEELLSVILSTGLEEIAERSNIDLQSLQSAISYSEGRDHHEKFKLIAQQLQLSIDQFTQKIMAIWIEQNKHSAAEFIKAFRTSIDS